MYCSSSGHPRRVGRDARGEDEVAAVGEESVVGAVLVHDGETLDPARRRTALGDVGDPRVEVALLAGEALVDRVRDLVREPPPLRRAGLEPQAAQLLPGEHVPEPELDRGSGAVAAHRTGDQRLRVDLAPVGEARQLAHLLGRLNVGAAVDGAEQAGAVEVGRDQPRDRLGQLARGGAVGRERADRDRHRLDAAAGDVDPELRERRRQPGRRGSERREPTQKMPAREAEPLHPVIIDGSKLKMMFRHTW